MLVLSRKLGEKIFVGDRIVVHVIDICRGRVRLGIEAPRDVGVLRDNAKRNYQQGGDSAGRNAATSE